MIKFNSTSEVIKLMALLIKDFLPKQHSKISNQTRSKSDESQLYVGIHEWGGYSMVREKNVRLINRFECGLKFQIERFVEYRGKVRVHTTVTMSESQKHENISFVKQNVDNFIETTNAGMDFAGYGAFFESIRNNKNAYVILTNSSVNSIKSDFIDKYIEYMEANPDVGMLGISYNSKCYQSLMRKNFTPHLQSFFLMTTIDVLEQIVKKNGGKFPGHGIRNKQLLIREGEIKMSQIVLSLGYNLAVAQQDGFHKFDNNKLNWNLKEGDSRIGCKTPNMIWSLS